MACLHYGTCDAGILADSSPIQKAFWRGPTGPVHPVRVAQPAPGPDRAHSPRAAGYQAEDLPTHAARVFSVPAMNSGCLQHLIVAVSEDILGMSGIGTSVQELVHHMVHGCAHVRCLSPKALPANLISGRKVCRQAR